MDQSGYLCRDLCDASHSGPVDGLVPQSLQQFRFKRDHDGLIILGNTASPASPVPISERHGHLPSPLRFIPVQVDGGSRQRGMTQVVAYGRQFSSAGQCMGRMGGVPGYGS